MRISQRMLSMTLIVLVILTLFFVYGWVNSMVSYKYQVQDFQRKGDDAFAGLDEEQISILHTIVFCKITAITCFALLILTLIVNEKEPGFNGRVYYTK
ncbi:hypothetical protein [Mucilaginibacter ginsenosidivorax]|uniref:Uncharacterized protein n=1 Tax=Mucilaginibacter ginsenosidivorax TaxID=862126 RepID=A0A5B8VYQ2_9SPHI|nr:hypothetical protein [Mucilaginibacter ginsenosidivorax]QEC75596.1 hypothetical protein FSB76_06415 [Mucilaginibacter ginsenosidivorax]